MGVLNDLAAECHAANQTWWHHPATGERLHRNKGELLMLIVSEVSEAMEGERKNRAFNAQREDHKQEARLAANGKQW